MWPHYVMEIERWLSSDVIQPLKEIGLSMFKDNLMTKRSRYLPSEKSTHLIFLYKSCHYASISNKRYEDSTFYDLI